MRAALFYLVPYTCLVPKKQTDADATGGRERRGFVQMNIRIPEELRRRFRASAVLEGREMSDLVEEMIREYLERVGR